MTDNNQSVYLKVLEILPKAWHGYKNAKEIVICALQIAHCAQSDNHYAYMAGYEAGKQECEDKIK